MKHIANGLGVSRGKIKGKVCVVNTLEDFEKFEAGMILVTHLTDPTMVPIMNKAAGIICNIGGLTSHPSIVSREMGIPCIVSTKCVKTGKQVSDILFHGQEILMCGECGGVHHVNQDELNQIQNEEKKEWKLKW